MALITVACLTSTILLIWWTMDSAGRHSIGAGKQMARAAEMMGQTVTQTAAVVKMQTELTETLLLGRRNPEIGSSPRLERTSETLPTPDELWRNLPDNIQEAMIRDSEDQATWPSLSETLLDPSVANGHPPADVPDLSTSEQP